MNVAVRVTQKMKNHVYIVVNHCCVWTTRFVILRVLRNIRTPDDNAHMIT